MRKAPRAGSVVLLWSLLTAACGPGEVPPVDRVREVDYELLEWTTELDAASLAALEAVDADGTLHFVDAPAEVLALGVGDIVLAGESSSTPAGLLVRVTAVEEAGGERVLRTEPASVFAAFRRLELRVVEPLTTDAPRGAHPPGAAREAVTLPVELGGPVDWEVFDGDQDPSTTEDRVTAEGEFTAQLTVTFSMSFNWADMSLDGIADMIDDLWDPFDTPTLAELLNLHLAFGVSSNLHAGLVVEGKAALSFLKEERLASFPLGTIWVGPIPIVPRFALDAKIEGGATSDLALEFGETVDLGLGVTFDPDDGFDPWAHGPEFTHEPPAATFGARADLRGSVTASIALLLFDVFGPDAGLEAYGEIDADLTREPCWEATAGVDATLGVSIAIAGYYVAGGGTSIPLAEEVVASGECPGPPTPPGALEQGWWRAYDSTCWGTSAPGGWTELERTIDGRWIVTSNTGAGLLKIDDGGEPLWFREYERTDAVASPDLSPVHATSLPDTGLLVTTDEQEVLRTDLHGTVVWARELDLVNVADQPIKAQARLGEDVLLGGAVAPTYEADAQAWLARLDGEGEVAFSRTFGAPNQSEEVTALLTLDDGVLVVGVALRHVSTDPMPYSFVLRLDQDGALRWGRRVHECADATDVYLQTAMRTMDGDFVLGGYARFDHPRALLVRLDADGGGDAPAWATPTLVDGDALGAHVTSLAQLATGEFRVAGTYFRATRDQIFLGATDAIGRFAWLRTYGGAGQEAEPALVLTEDEGIFLAASTSTAVPEPGGFWVLEVPRATGALAFEAASGLVAEDRTPVTEAITVCTPVYVPGWVDAPVALGDDLPVVPAAGP